MFINGVRLLHFMTSVDSRVLSSEGLAKKLNEQQIAPVNLAYYTDFIHFDGVVHLHPTKTNKAHDASRWIGPFKVGGKGEWTVTRREHDLYVMDDSNPYVAGRQGSAGDSTKEYVFRIQGSWEAVKGDIPSVRAEIQNPSSYDPPLEIRIFLY